VPAREAPVLGPAKPFIEAVLEADREAPRKQQHTAHRIWERIRAELGCPVPEILRDGDVTQVGVQLPG